MAEISRSVQDDGVVRRYDYEDGSVIVADLGFVDGSVDLVDDTAIVVTNDEQYEFEVPAGASRAFMTNGIVTIEVEG